VRRASKSGTPETERKSSASAATARHWAAKLAAARTPAERTAVEWDRARAAVKDLHETEQAEAWRHLASAIQTARQQIENR
jgi:hypothetical protein